VPQTSEFNADVRLRIGAHTSDLRAVQRSEWEYQVILQTRKVYSEIRFGTAAQVSDLFSQLITAYTRTVTAVETNKQTANDNNTRRVGEGLKTRQTNFGNTSLAANFPLGSALQRYIGL
jgi:SHS2 domain-containing protein